MRRFLTTSFIALALIIGATGVEPVAHAQECPGGTAGAGINEGKCFDANGDEMVGVAPTYTEDTLTDPAAAGTPVDFPETPVNIQGFGTVMTWIMSLFAWLVGVAALTLNYTVYFTVVTMGDYVNNLSAIGVTWQILRDIGNIMLIFGFLAVGITTILNVDWYGGGKKMLPMMFVAAVFLNFSLFISEAVIDTGNLFATQFYTQINGGTLPTRESLSATTVASEGISNKIMGQLGLQTIYTAGKVRPEVFKGGNTWLIGFMGIILFLVTAFVMFALAFILIARFVILIFLIILSPVGFAGLAIPQLRKRAGQWWEKLFEQTITAPVLLLMLYIALAVITDVQFLTGFCGSGTCTKDWTGFVSGNDLTGFASMLLSFLVAMGLLIAVVIQSKNLSAFGASWASKTAGALTFGATAFGMRSTAGWGLQGASQAIRRSRIGGTKTGRVLAGTFDRGAKASFDVRGIAMGGGLKGIGVDAGDAQKGGYRARRETAIKGHQGYIKSVGEAFDEAGISKEQEKAIEDATKAKLVADREHQMATEAVKEREERVRLLKEKGVSANELKTAEENLETSRTALNAAKVRQTAVTADLNNANLATARVGAAKKEAQLAYAENISGSLPGWALFGPGGSVAAKKIIKEAKKDQAAMDRDRLKKLFETADKEASEDQKEEKKEQKPEQKP